MSSLNHRRWIKVGELGRPYERGPGYKQTLQLDGNCLHFGVLLQAVFAQFAADSGLLESAERRRGVEHRCSMVNRESKEPPFWRTLIHNIGSDSGGRGLARSGTCSAQAWCVSEVDPRKVP